MTNGHEKQIVISAKEMYIHCQLIKQLDTIDNARMIISKRCCYEII